VFKLVDMEALYEERADTDEIDRRWTEARFDTRRRGGFVLVLVEISRERRAASSEECEGDIFRVVGFDTDLVWWISIIFGFDTSVKDTSLASSWDRLELLECSFLSSLSVAGVSVAKSERESSPSSEREASSSLER
jgi:hypothetical protein